VSAILVRAEQGTDPASVEARVQQQFPYAYLRVIGKNFSLQPVSRTVQGLPGLLNIISFIVILAALPLITLISAMAAHERQQEIGLLMSMGAKRVLIFFLALGESLILAIIGGITGVVVSLGFLILMEGGGFKNTVLQGFSAPSAAGTLMMAAFALGVVVLIGSIASLWPAYRSSRMNPYDAIRNPE
jgi:putative ABC transport system permease protein